MTLDLYYGETKQECDEWAYEQAHTTLAFNSWMEELGTPIMKIADSFEENGLYEYLFNDYLPKAIEQFGNALDESEQKKGNSKILRGKYKTLKCQ